MPTAHTHLHDPQTLYRHWEEEQWNPWEIDLAIDGEHWQEKMSEEDRSLVHWALSSLMVAEERIATKFSGLVMAYDSEEEESFLATQQVDEVRHMQFYKRFQDEAIADPQTIAVHVERARGELSDDFRAIFDEALVGAHERLASNPRDVAAKVDFVTTYHMVIEGTLGLTAFNFIARYLREEEMLPGFVDGYERITSRRSSETQRWRIAFARRWAASCRQFPPRSPRPSGTAPTGTPSAPPARRSATSPSAGSPAASRSSAPPCSGGRSRRRLGQRSLRQLRAPEARSQQPGICLLSLPALTGGSPLSALPADPGAQVPGA